MTEQQRKDKITKLSEIRDRIANYRRGRHSSRNRCVVCKTLRRTAMYAESWFCDDHHPEIIFGYSQIAEIEAELERDHKARAYDALMAALAPFADFGDYAQLHPRRGIGDVIYGWDNNEKAMIRQSDLIAAAELRRSLQSGAHA